MEKIIITTSFGLEALVKRELIDLGFEDFSVSDGMITLSGEISDIGKLHWWLL